MICTKTPRNKAVQNVNTRGGGQILPRQDFLDSLKMAAVIDAKLSLPDPASIWRRHSKFEKNRLTIFLKVKSVLLASFFENSSKKGKYSNGF